jgi:lysophospholipase L1-like esterase
MAMAMGLTAIPAEAASPPPVDYVALGDSYTAGTGAGEPYRPPGVDCWQSRRGYVDIVGQTGRVNLVANAACHGAVLSQASPTWDPVIYTPTVQEQLGGLVLAGKISAGTELVSITAGANDLGFSFVLGACSVSSEQVCAGAIDQATSSTALSFLTASLVQTYASIHAAAPNAKIAVMGYPLLFDPASSFAPIPPAHQQLMNQATVAVNATIASAADIANGLYQANAQYVDVTARFAGHASNSVAPWIVLDTARPTADYNFHPNRAGHSLGYAAALMTAVKPAQLVRP